ncbi:MAG: DUF484 family protein [Pseudomonadota bacterium]
MNSEQIEKIDAQLRESILEAPELILEDADLMRALVAANETASGTNVVDLRGAAMHRLENRLDRLEDTHRSVIAAAYENLAGTNQVHRATLKMLDPVTFEEFLQNLSGEVAQILRVDVMRLVMEAQNADEDPAALRLKTLLSVVPEGFVRSYLKQSRPVGDRQVLLRQVTPDEERIYGEATSSIRSEACLLIDLGPGRLPAMLVMGSEDPHLFRPNHGADLLNFFAGVLERSLRRWLA